uniref:Transposase n=1 Tax=Steinernema glaseri TaxID=37863 RepID=A0A1I7ZRP5_9BILA
MKLTSVVCGNLNKIHWNRRVWEIGYRGPPLPQRKATGRPHKPVTTAKVAELRENFEREYNVMRCLATPYFTKEQEAAYWAKHGSVDAQNEAKKLEAQQRRMPGEVKRETEFKKADRRVANIGNSLHKHRTIEDSLGELIRRNRWD